MATKNCNRYICHDDFSTFEGFHEGNPTSSKEAALEKEELEKFRGYIENGADASSQFDICPKSRIILMGFTKDMNEENKQSLVIHELYHAFQQDLSDESCRKSRDKSKSNHKWVVEGGAEYFAKVVTGTESA